MRKHFSTYIEQIAANEDVIFMTGDLGYNALENLAAKMGDRFINAGVAEQNMIGVAAGLAYRGYRVICYSIAPFVVYRCLEQIRNDACFHDLPVYIVGNGGGYGYGIMGSSHHCIEDIACLSGLPNMRCYVPSYKEDMVVCMDEMFARRRPAYLRLGLAKPIPDGMASTGYGLSRIAGGESKITIIAQGPVVNNVMASLKSTGREAIADVFIVNRMPFTQLPAEIMHSISCTGNVLTAEEHIETGGLGHAVSKLIHTSGLHIHRFTGLHAVGYPGGLYGSQDYHLQQSGLDEHGITNAINAYF